MSQLPTQQQRKAKDPLGELMLEYFHTDELFRDVEPSVEKSDRVVFRFAYRNVRISEEAALNLAKRCEALGCVRVPDQIRGVLDRMKKRQAESAPSSA